MLIRVTEFTFFLNAEPSLKLLILHSWKRVQCEFVLKHLHGLTLPSMLNQSGHTEWCLLSELWDESSHLFV